MNIEQLKVEQLIIHQRNQSTLIDPDDDQVENFHYKVDETGGSIPAGVGRVKRHTISWTEPPIMTGYKDDNGAQD